MNAVNQPFGDCPCESTYCKQVGTKLQRKTGHLVGCTCQTCASAENVKKGRTAHKRTHTNLGGNGEPPHHEGRARPYVTEIVTLPESTTGGQIPQSFRTVIGSEWFRHAIAQADREVPVGTGVVPAVAIDGRYLVVDLGDKRKVRR